MPHHKKNNFILLTIDVEDWFQVENFKPWIPFDTWSSYDLRVEKNTHRLLDLFDTFVSTPKTNPRTLNAKPETQNPIKATFFILGWIAERLPHLVREIHARGHEVASHGYNHNLCDEFSSEEFKTDLVKSKKLLEDIIGDRVYGYRIPSFGINNDILNIIQDCGYLYDSSYNSFALHDRYGKLSFTGIKKKGIAFELSENFFELPVSNITFKKKYTKVQGKEELYEGFVIPWGGGAYFRLIPFPLFKKGIKNILKKENTYLMYMHPWEIDPEQPRVKNVPVYYKFRHYSNLRYTYRKLLKLIEHFKFCRFVSCSHYIKTKINKS